MTKEEQIKLKVDLQSKAKKMNYKEIANCILDAVSDELVNRQTDLEEKQEKNEERNIYIYGLPEKIKILDELWYKIDNICIDLYKLEEGF